MNIRNLFYRTRNLIIQPFEAWDEIENEGASRNQVVMSYLLPMSIVVGLCSLFGTLFFSNIEDSLSVGYVVFDGIISFLIIFLEVYISCWLITEVAISFGDSNNSAGIFNLVIYSHAPFFLILSITKLFPPLFFMMILGAYSFYIFWLGMRNLVEIQENKKLVFLLLSSLVMILLFLLLSVIFDSIYFNVLDQFTTFGSQI